MTARRTNERDRLRSRAERLKQVEAELIAASGLSADGLDAAKRLRFSHGALMMMASEVQRARLLSGQSVDMHILLAVDAALKALLPAAPITVDVRYTDWCPRCRSEIAAEEAAARTKALECCAPAAG